MPKLVEGYSSYIWEHEDGSVSYTGSLNRAEWDDYLAKSGRVDAPEADEPAEEPDDSAPERPAGNASRDEWRDYALTQGASEEDIADLSRNELRDEYGSEEG